MKGKREKEIVILR